MSYCQTKGLTLTRRDSGEADRLFVVYTKDYGKLEILARGGKKTKSKLVSHLEPFFLSEILIAKGKSYDVLAGANSVYWFRNIWQSAYKSILATYCLELMDLLTQPAEPDNRAYELLIKTFYQLDRIKNKEKSRANNLIRIFAWQLLNIFGYQSELYHCLACQNKLVSGQNYFDAIKGGLVCSHCQSQGLVLVSNDAIKVLRWFLNKDMGDFARLKIDDKLKGEINHLIDSFVSARLETEVQSLKLIKSL